MATYTLTIDLTGFAYPSASANLIYQNQVNDLGISGNNTITSLVTDTDTAVEGDVSGGATVTYIINGDKVIFTLVTSTILDATAAGDLVALQFIDDDDEVFSASWVETSLCTSCQHVAVNNCGAVEISLPLPDDDYTVTLYDNQSGVAYTQNVQWTSGTGTWNSTNTAGVFTPFSIYTLTVTDSEGTPVSWPVGPDEYTCARVTFSATVDTNDAG